MKNISKVRCIIIDTGGMHVYLAKLLGTVFEKVRYYHPWESGEPLLQESKIGSGFEEFERIDNWHEHLDDTDLFIFPDLYYGPTQVWLEEQGFLVWGSKKAEKLEIDRVWCKEKMAELKLPVWPYDVVTGHSELTSYLKAHKNVWVKFSKWRGQLETFFAENYYLSRVKLADMYSEVLPYAERVQYILEKNMPKAIETALDTYNIMGKFPENVLLGMEIKNICYVCKFEKFSEILPSLTEFDTAMMPYLKSEGYTNCWSAEKRTGKDGISYMNDVCSRFPSPPGELYPLIYKNFPDIIWSGANGVLLEPEGAGTDNQFGAEVMIYTENPKDWQDLEFPKEYEDNLKFRSACRIDGKTIIVPRELPNEIIGSAVAVGRTLEQAYERADRIAQSVRGNGIFINKNSFHKVEEEIEKSISYNIPILGCS